MKIFFSILLLACPAACLFAQNDTVVVYYDRDGKPSSADNAISYALQVKERDRYKKLMVDGMDNKIRSIAYFTDADCKNFDGLYRDFYKTGKMIRSGYYVQNKKTGVWKEWTEDGKLTDSAFYKDGFIYGLGLSWDNDGKITDSLVFEEGGKGIKHGYWSNGHLSESGSYTIGKKSGLWTYYYKTGTKCQEVMYEADSAVSYTCFDEGGNIQKKDCIYEQEASFPGGEAAWVRYLGKKLGDAKLPDAYYKGKIYGQIWIQFIVNTEGNITDVKVLQSDAPALDAIAVSVIKKSPKWNHAVQYNRSVNAYRKQPITFPRMAN
jgi:TonB family protein